ncbi:MAG: hypothetical protein HRU19_27595 [Pseudobacteriovorax sp.]|nr:hypothetical protein [Pseudobacteriovorax sp.]
MSFVKNLVAACTLLTPLTGLADSFGGTGNPGGGNNCIPKTAIEESFECRLKGGLVFRADSVRTNCQEATDLTNVKLGRRDIINRFGDSIFGLFRNLTYKDDGQIIRGSSLRFRAYDHRGDEIHIDIQWARQAQSIDCGKTESCGELPITASRLRVKKYKGFPKQKDYELRECSGGVFERF